jgi:hypothetical protein
MGPSEAAPPQLFVAVRQKAIEHRGQRRIDGRIGAVEQTANDRDAASKRPRDVVGGNRLRTDDTKPVRYIGERWRSVEHKARRERYIVCHWPFLKMMR